MSEFQAPKGVPDYLPPESAEFVAVRDGLLKSARLAGYGDVETYELRGLYRAHGID